MEPMATEPMATEPATELQAVCVLGPRTELGSDVFLHEHLLFDHTAWLLPPHSAQAIQMREEQISLGRLAYLRENARRSAVNLRTPPVEALVSELSALRDGRPPFEGCTVVDASCSGSGRDLAGLAALSEASGVSIVASAGVAADEMRAHADDPDALADLLVAQLVSGIAVPGRAQPVRCGVLTASLEGAGSSPTDAMLQAAGQAQMRTGAPLLLLLPALPANLGSRVAVEACRTLIDTHGARPEAIIVCNAQHLLGDGRAEDGGALHTLLRARVSLCFGGLGCDWMPTGPYMTSSLDAAASSVAELEAPSDATIGAAVVELVVAGFASQLHLSLGICSQLQLTAFGGGGLTHLRRAFLPRLRRLGLSATDAELLCATNAARALAWWRPAGPAPRVCMQWSCAGCHRTFDEAVNEAEALPTDQEYYEKMGFRYCGMHCLRAHRVAGFVSPFSCPVPPS